MKAITINKPNDISLNDVAMPAMGEDEALIRVAYSGVCATDIAILSGNMSLVREGLIKYPVRIGHEWSGVIIDTGARVKNFKAGDRVVSDSGVSCGICETCLAGDYASCPNTKSVGTINCWDGSFAEYMTMPERHLHRLPLNVSLLEGALVEPAAIALCGVRKTLEKGIPAAALVIGTGAIGMAAVAFFKHFGVKNVVLCGRSDDKLEAGRKMGADAVINVKRENICEAVLNLTGGARAGAVVETSGNPDTINDSVLCCAVRGIVSLIGFYETEINYFPVDAVVSREITICGIMGEYGSAQQVLDILGKNDIKLTSMVTCLVDLNNAKEAICEAAKSSKGRIKLMVKVFGDGERV